MNHILYQDGILKALPFKRLPWLQARMVLGTVNGLEPNEANEDADDAHEVKDGRPAIRVHQPAHDGSEQGGREVLRRVEDGRGGAALIGREPGGDDAPVGWEGGSLRQADQQTQRKQSDDSRSTRSEKTDRALEQGENRPDEDAPEVDGSRAETIEQPSSGDLRDHVGPAEG